VPNVALDILVNVVKTKILLIFISLSSFVFIFVLVLVSSTIIPNVFIIFVIVFVVVDEKNTGGTTDHLSLSHTHFPLLDILHKAVRMLQLNRSAEKTPLRVFVTVDCNDRTWHVDFITSHHVN